MSKLHTIQNQLNQVVVGQPVLVERMIEALLADGHILVEGAPGLAKTRAVRNLAAQIEGDFQRIQFTPDLLPADITGTDIYRPQTGDFQFQQGPIFHNFVLADEINRAPAKVQAALLEAMAERQVTVGGHTLGLPEIFMVMATQNPIEQEGTYPLPEAQLDRFLLHVEVDFPDATAERAILALNRGEAMATTTAPIVPLSKNELLGLRREVLAIHMDPSLEDYLLALIMATRTPADYDAELKQWIEYGASPRATIGLDRSARARALLLGRDFVTPDDIQQLFPDIVRHRVIMRYQAEAAGISKRQVIERILDAVVAP